MIIIASDVTSTGLSFTNVRKFIHGGPSFNLTRQPEGRTNRADSHRAFSRPEQRFVRRYLMAATLGDGTQTIDHQIWYQIQEKEAGIIPPEKALGDISVDCAFNNRNGTCFNQLEDVVPQSDLTTYHLHWATQEFDTIEKRIRHFFLMKPAYAFEDLKLLLSDSHSESTLAWTLTSMIGRRDLIRDRFGFCRVLREHHGVYYLAGSFETTRPSDETMSHPILSHDRFLEEYSSVFRVPLPEDFTTMSAKVIAQSVKSVLPDHDLNAFKLSWEKVDGEVRMVELERALTGQIENREVAAFVLRDLDVAWFKDGKSIFHYLDEVRPKGNGGAYQANRHKIDGKAGKVSIRILHQGDSAFKAANDGETARAVKMINDRWTKRDALIASQSGVKFTVINNASSDRQIRIRDDSNVKIKADQSRDMRGDKGRLWNLHDLTTLLGYIWDMQYENPNKIVNEPGSNDITANYVRKRLVKVDTKNWPPARFTFYWRWLEDGSTTVDRLVKIIVTHFERQDLILKK